MRLFQNSALYPSYVPRLRHLGAGIAGFAGLRDVFLADRFGAPHFLKPVLDGNPDAFFTNGDDAVLQRAWAREHGLKPDTALDDILLSQIEDHRTEVFYNIDPVRYGAAFLRRLPGSVRRRIAWRAAPSGNADFSGYDLMVCNFPSILAGYRAQGLAAGTDRPIDVLFVGGYTRHHARRAALLEHVAGRLDGFRVVMRLDRSRLTQLAETPVGLLPGLSGHRRPAAIRAVSQPPVFGLELYQELAAARIVLNGAIDMAAADRGNMRCFETMGAGSLLVSDAGLYPDGMVDGDTFIAYASADEAVSRIKAMLSAPETAKAIAARGHDMIRTRYSKSAQWARFVTLAA
jgi:Glycosyl transferases group 1